MRKYAAPLQAALAILVAAAMLSACGGDGGSKSSTQRVANNSSPVPLERGQPFPEVTVTGLDSVKVSTTSLLRGHETFVLFISTACEACSDLLKVWNRRAGEIPEGMNVLLIVDEEVDYAARYASKAGIGFPLYCDTRSVFAKRHKMEVYPTAVAVRADGTMAFVRRGVTPLFTPDRAVMTLRRGDRES